MNQSLCPPQAEDLASQGSGVAGAAINLRLSNAVATVEGLGQESQRDAFRGHDEKDQLEVRMGVIVPLQTRLQVPAVSKKEDKRIPFHSFEEPIPGVGWGFATPEVEDHCRYDVEKWPKLVH